MKTVQLILRIILAPIVFIGIFGAMSLFPGPFCLGVGTVEFILKLCGCKVSDTYEELVEMTLMWIIFPICETKSFILNGKFS